MACGIKSARRADRDAKGWVWAVAEQQQQQCLFGGCNAAVAGGRCGWFQARIGRGEGGGAASAEHRGRASSLATTNAQSLCQGTGRVATFIPSRLITFPTKLPRPPAPSSTWPPASVPPFSPSGWVSRWYNDVVPNLSLWRCRSCAVRRCTNAASSGWRVCEAAAWLWACMSRPARVHRLQQADFRPRFSSCRSPQVALTCSYRSDRVTRD